MYLHRLWWQYLLATVPLLIAILLFIFSTVESVIIGKEAIRFEKYNFCDEGRD